MKTIFHIAILLLLLSSCKEEKLQDFKQYQYGESFVMKKGETIELISGTDKSSLTSVVFDDIMNDDRCYLSQCELCYGSAAKIQLSISHQGESIALPLSVLGCSGELLCDENYYYRKDTLGYRICLLSLNPYPDTNNVPIEKSAYQAKIKISEL